MSNGKDSHDDIANALGRLSPQGRALVADLIRRLSGGEGINPNVSTEHRLDKPADGIPLWAAKLRAERRSERTVQMYGYLARRHLGKDPHPTRLGLQAYFAQRLREVSPAAASNERKAMASLFGFLKSEGLWPDDPTEGVGLVRVHYRERLCPDLGDVLRVLESKCLRRKDTEKLRVLTLLLATTGLRLGEAAGIRREDIDLEAPELRVTGKGGRRRTVPLLPQTAEALSRYMWRFKSGSPFLFPGDTRTGHMNIHNFEKTLRRACHRLGVRPFTPHQLRHLYATHMLRNGAKLEVVSRILGHTSVGVTGDIYRHVMVEEMREAARRFAPLNGGGAGE